MVTMNPLAPNKTSGASANHCLNACSRVYFGNCPVIQPMKVLLNGTPVCEACADMCVYSSHTAVRALPPPDCTTDSAMRDHPKAAHVCKCVGSTGGVGCVFQARFAEKGDPDTLRTIAAQLTEKYFEQLRDITENWLRSPLGYSAQVFSRLDGLTEEHFRRANPHVLTCIGVLNGSVRTSLHADEETGNAADRIHRAVELFDRCFAIDEYYTYPEPVEEVAKRNPLLGNTLERCLLLMALVRLCVPQRTVDVRVVMSPEVGVRFGQQALWSHYYLQYRLAEDDGQPPSVAWRWAYAEHHNTRSPNSTRPPTSNDKSRVYLGIRSSGLMEDSTTNPQADGVLYCATTFQNQILERNIQFSNSDQVSDDKRRQIKGELRGLLLDMKDEFGSKLRNQHRQLVSLDIKTSVSDLICTYNHNLEQHCVDNASPVPLRKYTGEVDLVRTFFDEWASTRSADEVAVLTQRDETRRACQLLKRCFVYWPTAGQQMLLLSISEIIGLGSFLANPFDVATLLGPSCMDVFNCWGSESSRQQSLDNGVSIGLLRLIENIFTAAEDHILAVARLGRSAAQLLGVVTACRDGRCHRQQTYRHNPFQAVHQSAATALYASELDYQLSLTLQAMSQSLVIASFAVEGSDAPLFEGDDASSRTTLNDVTHTVMLVLVKSIRNATQDYRGSIFSLIEAAQTVIVAPLVALINAEGVAMLVDTLQLAYNSCPLRELTDLVDVATSLNASVTRR
jgi:hypothetical protein